jgi:hypothetical protein
MENCVRIRFEASVEGAQAFLGNQLVGVILAPSRSGGEYWCRNTLTGVLFKGLTLESARARLVDTVRAHLERKEATKNAALLASRQSQGGEKRSTPDKDATWSGLHTAGLGHRPASNLRDRLRTTDARAVRSNE